MRNLAIGVLAAVGYAVADAVGAVPKPIVESVTTIASVLPFVLVAASIWAARRSSGRTRRGWTWLSIAFSGEVVYSIIWMVLSARGQEVPAVIDAASLVVIPLGAVGILNLAVRRDRSSTLRRLLDATLIGGSLFIVSWSMVLRVLYLGGSGSFTERTFALAYPMGDVVIMTLVAFVATRYRSGGTTPLKLIGLSMIVWSITDTTFSYLSFRGAYHPGDPIEVAWLVGYGLLLAAALRRRPVDHADELPRELPPVRLPYWLVAGSFVVGIGAQVVHRAIDPVVLYGLLALCVAVLVRQFIAVLENQSVTIGELRSLDDTKTNIMRAVFP